MQEQVWRGGGRVGGRVGVGVGEGWGWGRGFANGATRKSSFVEIEQFYIDCVDGSVNLYMDPTAQKCARARTHTHTPLSARRNLRKLGKVSGPAHWPGLQ